MSATSLPANNQPLSLESTFSDNMHALLPDTHAPKLAVACSGGADSMALTLLAHAWASAHRGQITALIVDHGLRDASAEEAVQTAAWLHARGIAAQVFSLQLERTPSALQERARHARYEALQNACLAQHIPHLLTAHHQDDQIETMLFRLMRGSGVHGLAAMSAKRQQQSLSILRPLLNVGKAQLLDHLAHHKQPYIHDPSNNNTDFARVRVRHMLRKQCSPAEKQRLAAINHAFARMRQQDEIWLLTLANRYAQALNYGVLRIQPTLLDEPPHIAIWLLKHLFTVCHGSPFPPRQHEVETLYEALKATPTKTRSLHHCLISHHQGDYYLYREPAHTHAPLALKPSHIHRWDGRFTISTQHRLPRGLQLQTLGAQGVALCKQHNIALPTMPYLALQSLPAIYNLEGELYLPHIQENDTQNISKHLQLRFTPAKLLGFEPFFFMNKEQK